MHRQCIWEMDPNRILIYDHINHIWSECDISVSEKLGFEKNIGFGIEKVSVSISKNIGIEKSFVLGKFFGIGKKFRFRLDFWFRHSLYIYDHINS